MAHLASFIDPGRLRGGAACTGTWTLQCSARPVVALAFNTNMPTLVCVALACVAFSLLLTLGPLLHACRT